MRQRPIRSTLLGLPMGAVRLVLSSLEKAARTHAVEEIGGLVEELTQKLKAVNAELREAG